MTSAVQILDTPGALLRLIRAGEHVTRSGIVEETGLTRARVGALLTPLLGDGLVTERRGTVSSGGRPPNVLRFNPAAGVLLVGDLASVPARLAVADLSGSLLCEAQVELDPRAGPEPALERLDESLPALLAQTGREDVHAVGFALPEPAAVDEEFPLAAALRARFTAPVVVERAAVAAAIAEHRRWRPPAAHMIYVTLQRGLACAIVADGRIHRGHNGSAGGLAHMRLSGQDTRCWCGGVGCLEAVIGAGLPARAAGRLMGEVLAACAACLDPDLIVIAGLGRDVEDAFLAGTRETLAIGAGELPIVPARLRQRAALLGMAQLAVDEALRAML